MFMTYFVSGYLKDYKGFLQKCMHNFIRFTAHAKEIVKRYPKLKKKNKDIIFNEQWWDNCRFQIFGTVLKKKIDEKPEAKEKIIAMFKN